MSQAETARDAGDKQGSFARGLGLVDATNIVAGAMIGSGIFLVSQDIAKQVGSPGWLLLVWIITAVMTVVVALSYGELAAMYPSAGGQYVYLREAYSPLWGFLYGWTLFMVIQSGSIAAVGMAFAKYLGGVVPGVSEQIVLLKLGPISISTAHLVALAVIALLTANNCVNLNAGKWVQNVFTVAKIGSLAAVALVGIVWARPDGAMHEAQFWTARATDGTALIGLALIAAVGSAMVGSMFAADAWNNVTFVAGEVREPRRNVPLSLALGAGGVMVLYLLVNVSYLNLLPFQALVDTDKTHAGRVAAAALERVWPWGGQAISFIVLVSTFGCLNGMILSGPRLYWAMAQDGLFFKAAGHLGKKSRVPVAGLVLQGVWSGVLTLSGKYGDLLDYVIFAAMLFYVMSVVGIFILRKRAPELPRPYKAWGYPWAPAGYVIAASAMMIVLLVYKPTYTWPGLGIVALGAPVYWLWKQFGGGSGRTSSS